MRVGRLLAHIPARGGSKRVPAKNLRLLGDKPMIGYAIDAGQACPEILELYVNTDSDTIAAYAESRQCAVYRRPVALGSDETSGEEFTADIIEKFAPDTLLMISPVCPFIEAADLSAAIRAFEASTADALISCSATQLQTFCDGKPVNVEIDGPLAPSQRNPVVSVCNWAVTIWNTETFLRSFRSNGSGYFGRQRELWPIDPWKAVKVSTESDFEFAERLLALSLGSQFKGRSSPRYWRPGR